MPKLDWQKFLRRWSDAIIASGEYSTLLDQSQATRGSASFLPATEEAIADAESRLELRLPGSYRAFLQVSNGWWLDGTAGPTRLCGVEEICPMREAQPETVDIWSAIDSGGERESDASELPNSHYRSVIRISEDNDGVYLLNPLIQPAKDEWQAAFFANWVPGAECYESFESLMKAKYEAFIAAHPVLASTKRAPRLNLKKPPAQRITDPHEFIEELQRLGFFDLMPEPEREDMIRDFHDVYQRFEANKHRELRGRFASPGAVLCDPRSGRVVNLDVARLATERARYAVAMVRPLLASVGIELGPVEEQITEDAYGATLEGISHQYFKLRDGYPALPGGKHEVNAARYALYQTAILLNKVLSEMRKPERIAKIEELRNGSGHQIELRPAFIMVDDELSYLFAWSPVIDNDCRPIRPDVWQ